MPYIKIEVPEKRCRDCKLMRRLTQPFRGMCIFRKEGVWIYDARPVKACKEARIK